MYDALTERHRYLKVRYESSLVDVISRSKLPAGVQGEEKTKIGAIGEGNWWMERNGVSRQYVTDGIHTDIMT
jgi:hypothetical protein